jgi:multicomponent Na+:H+ antiporter subunit G
MKDVLTALLLLSGSGFMLLAAVGVLRLPDLFIRMHSATKSGTLGVSGTILAVAVHFADLSIAIRSVLIIIFLFMTAPVAAHMIGRAAYLVGVPLWKNTVVDELAGRYDKESGQLTGFVRKSAPSEERMEED